MTRMGLREKGGRRGRNFLLLAAMLLLAWGSTAKAVDYIIDNTVTPSGNTYNNLIDAVNAAMTAGGVKSDTFNLQSPSGTSDFGNIASPPTNIGTAAWYDFHNVIGSGTNTFNSVTITGVTAPSAGGYYQLGYENAAYNTNKRVFAFTNTQNLAISRLDISGGNVYRSSGLSDDQGTGGAAIYLSVDDPARSLYTLTFSDMNLHENHVLIEQADTADPADNGYMAAGGALFITGTSNGAPSGAATFTNVSLMGNTATMSNGKDTDTFSNASGGGARLVNLTSIAFSGGTVDNNLAELEYGSHAVGGGLDIEADGETTATIGKTGTATIFKNNLAVITEATTNNHASGGALYFYNGTTGAAGSTTASIAATQFTDNSTSAYNSTANTDTGTARGGAVHYEGNLHGTVDTSAFTGNWAESAYGTAQGGAVSINSNYTAAAGSPVFAFSGNTFSENVASGVILAQGGAIGSNSRVISTGDTFDTNATNAGGISNAHAQGGALYLEATDNTITKGTFTANSAEIFDNFESNAASGGAAYFAAGGNTITGLSSFTNNLAIVNHAIQSSFGGALYFDQGDNAIEDSAFTGNQARIDSTSLGSGHALGGAAYFADDENTITGSTFTGNLASVDTTTQRAYGGALYFDQGVNTVADSTFTGNEARNDATASLQTHSQGGAIFVNTESTTASRLNLVASAGKEVLFSGNYSGGFANSIYYGRVNDSNSGADAILNIDTAANALYPNDPTKAGKVSLLDPILVDMENSQGFTMNKTGAGELLWDGKNEITSSFNLINLTDGIVTAGDYFTTELMGSGDSRVDIEENTTLNFNLSRATTGYNDTAMFQFLNTNDNRYFNVGDGSGQKATLGIDLGRQIMNVLNEKFVIASGLDYATATTARGNFQHSPILNLAVEADPNDSGKYRLVTTALWYSPYYRSTVNARSAWNAGAVNSLAWAGGPGNYVLSRGEVDLLRNNPRAVTPELYMDMGFAFLDTVDTVSRTAANYGVIQPWRSQFLYGSGGAAAPAGPRGRYPTYSSYRANGALAAPSDRGFRLWAGYLGDFRDYESSADYNGYKIDRNGFLIGLNYDLGSVASVGIYGGYTHADARAHSVDSKNKADAGHFGLVGRLSPFSGLPCLSFYGDIGYHFADNDYWRRLGPATVNGSFDQGVFTLGLGADYQFKFGNFNIVPGLKARYLYLDQDGMNETGLSATHIGGPSRNGFNTRLGVDASYDFHLGSAVVTPVASLAWRHEFGSRYLSSSAYYLADPNPVVFGVNAAPIDRDSADIGAAIKARFNLKGKTSLGVNVGYNLNISRHIETHTVYAGVEVGF